MALAHFVHVPGGATNKLTVKVGGGDPSDRRAGEWRDGRVRR